MKFPICEMHSGSLNSYRVSPLAESFARTPTHATMSGNSIVTTPCRELASERNSAGIAAEPGPGCPSLAALRSVASWNGVPPYVAVSDRNMADTSSQSMSCSSKRGAWDAGAGENISNETVLPHASRIDSRSSANGMKLTRSLRPLTISSEQFIGIDGGDPWLSTPSNASSPRQVSLLIQNGNFLQSRYALTSIALIFPLRS